MPRHLNIPEWGIQILERKSKLYIVIATVPVDSNEDTDVVEVFVGATTADTPEEAISNVPQEERKNYMDLIAFDLIDIVKQARTLEITANVMSSSLNKA